MMNYQFVNKDGSTVNVISIRETQRGRTRTARQPFREWVEQQPGGTWIYQDKGLTGHFFAVSNGPVQSPALVNGRTRERILKEFG